MVTLLITHFFKLCFYSFICKRVFIDKFYKPGYFEGFFNPTIQFLKNAKFVKSEAVLGNSNVAGISSIAGN